MLVDNKKKDILVLGEGLTQGLDDTPIITEAKYPINFKQSGKKINLSLHYNLANSFFFFNTANRINSVQRIEKENHIYCV